MLTRLSPRAWLLGGFAISLSSVLLNTLVLAQLNGRLAKVNGEIAGIKESLAQMVSEIRRAETKYEMVRMFHWVAMSAPEKYRDTARREAAYPLVNYFTRSYAAVKDISPVEVMRTEMIEMEDDYAAMQKLSELATAYEQADESKRPAIEKEIDAVDADACQVPKTELGKKFAELAEIGLAEAEADDESSLLLRAAPTMQKLRDEFIRAHEVKSARLKQLEQQKQSLISSQTLTTSLAVGLQLLGLFFILSRDLVKDYNEARKKQAQA